MSINAHIIAGWNKIAGAIKDIIFPPFYPLEDDLNTRSNLLRLFTLITMFLGLVVFIEVFFVSINKPVSAAQALLLFLISLFVYYLNKKGYFRAAVIIYILCLWIGSTFTMLVSGGMNGPYGYMYVATIAIAGLVLGPRTVWAATAFITVSGLAIVYIEEALNPLPILYPSPPLGVWATLSVLIVVVTVAIQFTQSRASEAVSHSMRELDARRTTESALLIQNRLMQDINELGIELAALPADTNLHRFLVQKLKQLSGASVVTIGEFVPDSKAVHVRHVEIDDDILQLLSEQTDPDIISFASGLGAYVSPIPEEMHREIFSQIAGYRDTASEITIGAVPTEISDKISRIFSFDRYAGIAYIFENTLYGSSILAFKRDQVKPSEELLHAFSALAAVSLRRKKAEDELRDSESKYRLLAENVTDVIWTIDMDLKFTFISPSIYGLKGLSVDEAMAQSLDMILTPDSLQIATKILTEELAMENIPGNDPKRTRVLELEEFRKDGSPIWTENTMTFLRDNRGKATGILGVTREISERKKAEEQRTSLQHQMLQAQKLESLGLLAGGIAHDFNNILSAVLGYSELALLSVPKQSSTAENILEIEKAAKRAADLSRQMLAYSGRGKFVIEAIDLNELVRGISHLLSVSVSKGVTLQYNLAPGLPPIDGDNAQIQQVVMNLVTNAYEAIGDHDGIINIVTGSMHCDRKYLMNCTSPAVPGADGLIKEDTYIYFEVSDTGCGMGKSTIARIFDPFFTTKRTGRGLGLAAVQGIIRGHRGAISISSQPQKGTIFRVLFPPGTIAASQDGGVDERARIRKFGSGSLVLLVDDEEAIRTVGQAMLHRLGFKVVTAADGYEGIDIFQARGDEIACVILDMTMPHMDGEAVFSEIMRIDPQAKVILSSGYSEHEASQLFSGRGLAGFLQKPYSMSELTARLKDALSHKGVVN